MLQNEVLYVLVYFPETILFYLSVHECQCEIFRLFIWCLSELFKLNVFLSLSELFACISCACFSWTLCVNIRVQNNSDVLVFPVDTDTARVHSVLHPCVMKCVCLSVCVMGSSGISKLMWGTLKALRVEGFPNCHLHNTRIERRGKRELLTTSVASFIICAYICACLHHSLSPSLPRARYHHPFSLSRTFTMTTFKSQVRTIDRFKVLYWSPRGNLGNLCVRESRFMNVLKYSIFVLEWHTELLHKVFIWGVNFDQDYYHLCTSSVKALSS